MKEAFSGGIIPHYLGKLIGTANPTEVSTRYLSLKKEKTESPLHLNMINLTRVNL